MTSKRPPARPEALCAAQDGAEIMVQPDHSFPVVRFVVAHRRGAVDDPVGRAGRARLWLEMALRGTETRDRATFNRRLEQLGASVDTHVGHEAMRVRGICLAPTLPEVLAMVAEALLTPAWAAAEWDSLKSEAADLADLERDDDDSLADLFMRRVLYAGHPLGRPAGGDATSLARLRAADLQDAQRLWGRDGTVVALAGPVDLAQAQALAAPLSAGLPAGTAAAAATAAPSAAAAGLRIVVVDRPDRTQVQMRVAQLACDAFHPDTDMLALAVMAFGGTFTSPLTQQIRDERGWSYFAHADFRRRSRHLAPVTLRCAPSLEDAVDCLALNLELFAALAEGSLPTRDHLEAARHYILGRYPFEIASAHGRLSLAVVQRLLGLPVADILAMPARWAAMDLDAVPAMLRRTLRADGATACLVASAEAMLPRLTKRFPAAQIEVVPYQAAIEI